MLILLGPLAWVLTGPESDRADWLVITYLLLLGGYACRRLPWWGSPIAAFIGGSLWLLMGLLRFSVDV